jgi:hypothetical protein
MTNNRYVLTVIAIFLSLGPVNQLEGFNSITELEQYAATLPEDVKADNNDIVSPDYSRYYKSKQLSLFQKIAQAAGLTKKPLWSYQLFVELLEKGVKQQQQLGRKDPFAVVLNAHPEVNVIIWGSLNGAFHSLVRDLVELRSQKIITDTFELLMPHSYIVFNGNVIDGSPFILETLTVILQLFLRNPDKVFYNKGSFEEGLDWQNKGLKRELNFKNFLFFR